MKNLTFILAIFFVSCSGSTDSTSGTAQDLTGGDSVNDECAGLTQEVCEEEELCSVRLANRADQENACWRKLEYAGCIRGDRNCTNNIEYPIKDGECWYLRSGCFPDGFENSGQCDKFKSIEFCD